MPFIYGAKKSADFPRHNQIQSIVIVATCMFLQTSITVRHSQSPSVLGVKAQQCLISFETAVHCRELELQLFNKWLRDECICFVCGNCLETAAQRCSVKKVFLAISQNSQENTCARVFFLVKLQARDSGTGVFLWILRNF